jgi:hypothetical protein
MDLGGQPMFFGEPLPFVKEYISKLNTALENYKQGSGLSWAQRKWICFCLMGILVTNSVCWAKFERAGLKEYTLAALSWMFRKSKIRWELLLCMSVKVILARFGITGGELVIDDTDKKRSKSTRKIYKAHKIKDKASGGYVNGQSMVVLLLVTPIITIPVGFWFYLPDPALTAWYKREKELKEKGVSKAERPSKPVRNPDYPTKQEIGLKLLEQFRTYHPEIRVKVIDADALYGTSDFMEKASKIFGGVQVISQLRSNQIIHYRNKRMSVREYFAKHPGVAQKITIRGGEEMVVLAGSARLYVGSHKKKRFVIALKYEGEEEYRYLLASDLSWRTVDIIQAYSLRWLVEVFFSDWKLYEGWGQLTKQPDEEGSSRSLILSLLLDHCLFFHPQQLTRLENKLPACTVGSLRDKIRAQCLLEFIRGLLLADNVQEKLDLLAKTVEEVFHLADSKKHMNGRDLGRLEPTPSLKYKNKKACAYA